MSSMIANASSNTLTPPGIDLPSKASTPTANAISVAVGTAQPSLASVPWLIAMYINAGTNTPPSAAPIGSKAILRLAKAPSWIS
ncbi:hypothetical protein D9M73_191760 [compost metagenome]